MTTFDDRETAFENKFAHDAELEFKAEARRNRLLGQWAAGLLGKTGEDAERYSHEVIRSDLQGHGEEDVFRKVKADLGAKADDSTIRAKMVSLMQEARAQVAGEAS